MSHLFLFWLLFFLGDLFKNASHFIGSFTLLKKRQLAKTNPLAPSCLSPKLKLMCLGLRKEDLFALPL
jgi:hypothetical protein